MQPLDTLKKPRRNCASDAPSAGKDVRGRPLPCKNYARPGFLTCRAHSHVEHLLRGYRRLRIEEKPGSRGTLNVYKPAEDKP